MIRVLTVFFLVFAGPASAQSIVGKWKTIDDNTGEAKSIVEIYEKDGKFYGKVTKIFLDPNEDPDPVCDECDKDDPRYKKKIIGMEIIRGLKKDDDEFSGGDILDPENGKVYRCRLWVEKGDLMVRGYWGPFFRTQTWKRA
jgi:uncharacterized protein (DUF2147 family)